MHGVAEPVLDDPPGAEFVQPQARGQRHEPEGADHHGLAVTTSQPADVARGGRLLDRLRATLDVDLHHVATRVRRGQHRYPASVAGVFGTVSFGETLYHACSMRPSSPIR